MLLHLSIDFIWGEIVGFITSLNFWIYQFLYLSILTLPSLIFLLARNNEAKEKLSAAYLLLQFFTVCAILYYVYQHLDGFLTLVQTILVIWYFFLTAGILVDLKKQKILLASFIASILIICITVDFEKSFKQGTSILKDSYCFYKAYVHQDQDCAYYLWEVYGEGVGVKKDQKKAEKWLDKAAEWGNSEAQVLLAKQYKKQKDYDNTLLWLNKAVAQNNSHAKYEMWVMYINGLGVKKDQGIAMNWLDKAAKQGDDRALYQYGKLFEQGTFFKKDRKQSLIWYCKSALQGNALGQLKMGNFYYNLWSEDYQENIKLDCDDENKIREKISEFDHIILKTDNINYTSYYSSGSKIAYYWYVKAADQGVGEAVYELQNFLSFTDSTAKSDHERTIDLIYKAAKLGYAPAQYQVYIRMKNIYGDSDLDSLSWLKKAAKNNDYNAQYDLAEKYYYGDEKLGIKIDYVKAFDLYEKSAKQNFFDAQYMLGNMYLLGTDIRHNDKRKAFEWLGKAVEKEHKIAQYMLGNMYNSGQYVNQNTEKALILYEKSAEQGYTQATEEIYKICRHYKDVDYIIPEPERKIYELCLS